ncbi:PREDICTED: lysine-rich arabinogalactan protein 19-like [Camelina sativa]|uniref:Lysine-rich arabinogalactan protein 19-like n=1 Tax=Camelina sativa TaxID=90675 RepID=A0ABM0UJB5_CAMSA|nr:PREDICTED: lysine-rich arabinogalactan protein 19-like [Camelina sativa]
MDKARVMSLVSANLVRGSFILGSSRFKPWSTRLMTAAKSVSCTSKPVRGLTNYSTGVYFVSQTGPPEIQFPGSEEEVPSRPSRGPELAPLEVPELPNIPEIKPSKTPPEVTTVPSDPPPLGPPQTLGPEFPVPPSPSPPMPDTPNPPTPESPPDVPPNWEPPRPPEIQPPGIDPPPPLGPTIM